MVDSNCWDRGPWKTEETHCYGTLAFSGFRYEICAPQAENFEDIMHHFEENIYHFRRPNRSLIEEKGALFPGAPDGAIKHLKNEDHSAAEVFPFRSKAKSDDLARMLDGVVRVGV